MTHSPIARADITRKVEMLAEGVVMSGLGMVYRIMGATNVLYTYAIPSVGLTREKDREPTAKPNVARALGFNFCLMEKSTKESRLAPGRRGIAGVAFVESSIYSVKEIHI